MISSKQHMMLSFMAMWRCLSSQQQQNIFIHSHKYAYRNAMTQTHVHECMFLCILKHKNVHNRPAHHQVDLHEWSMVYYFNKPKICHLSPDIFML